MTPARIALLVSAVVALILLAWFPITDQDVDFHLAAGRQIATDHAIPQTNVFGYTLPDVRWASHQWLGSLLIYGAYRLGESIGVGGAAGLTGAKCAVVVALFGFLLAAIRRERPARGPWDEGVAALVLVLAAWSARPRLIERPLLLSALGEAVLLWFLAGYERRTRRRLLWLIPIFVTWWNLHAGYVYGLLILAAFIAGDALEPARRAAARRLVPAAAAAVASGILVAWLVNPGSLRGLVFPLTMFRSPTFSQVIDEFHRTTPGTNPAFSALVLGALAAVALATFRKRRPRAAHLLLLAGFAALAISRVRMILDFSVVSAPLIAGALVSVLPRPGVPGARRAAGSRGAAGRVGALGARLAAHAHRAPVAAALLIAVVIPWRVARGEAIRFGHGFDPRNRPFAAYDYLERARLPERVVVTDLWSGSFLWRFYPARRVFVHNQLEVYDENFARDVYLPFLRAEPGWQGMLDRVGVNTLVLRYSAARFDQRIAGAAFEDPGWALVYWDDVAMIFVRNTPANAGVIGPSWFRVVNPDAADPASLVASGRGDAAESELRAVLARDPGCTRAWGLLGDVELALGRPAEGEAAYREIARRSAYPDEAARALAGCARTRLAAGRAAEAVDLCDQALRVRRRDPSVRALRAMALIASGRAEEARGETRALLRAGDVATLDLLSLAFTWEQAGGLREAEEGYRRAMAADPRNGETVTRLAWVVGREGKTAEALDLAHQAVRLAPADGVAWSTLGMAFLTGGRPDSAVVAFERSRELLGGARGSGGAGGGNDAGAPTAALNPATREALANALVGLSWAYQAVGRADEGARAQAEAQALGVSAPPR